MNKAKLSTVLLVIASLTLVLLSFTLILSPKIRFSLNNLIENKNREIIAILETNLSIPNKDFKILKIKQNSDLWIEIYDLSSSKDRVAQFQLLKKTDAQMFVDKKSSSLFASDLDGDEILEILAPSFNSKLHPKIHAFRYNPTTDSFSQITDQNLIQNLNL